MTDKLRDAAQKALARMEQDYDIACETEEGGEASEYCVGLLSDISALRAALTQQDAQAWQAAKWEAIRAVQHQYLGIVKAATNLLAEIDARHDNADAPLKYAVPYGAVTALREALTAKPLAQQDAQAVPPTVREAAAKNGPQWDAFGRLYDSLCARPITCREVAWRCYLAASHAASAEAIGLAGHESGGVLARR